MDSHAEKLVEWVKFVEDQYKPSVSEQNAGHALYAFTETGAWGTSDLDGITFEDAKRVWAVMETLRRFPFPEDLRV